MTWTATTLTTVTRTTTSHRTFTEVTNNTVKFVCRASHRGHTYIQTGRGIQFPKGFGPVARTMPLSMCWYTTLAPEWFIPLGQCPLPKSGTTFIAGNENKYFHHNRMFCHWFWLPWIWARNLWWDWWCESLPGIMQRYPWLCCFCVQPLGEEMLPKDQTCNS